MRPWFPGGARRGGQAGGDEQVRGQRDLLHDQRVIPRRREVRRQASEDAAAVVADRGGVAMRRGRRANDPAAVCRGNGLVAEADAQQRRDRSALPDDIDADPRLARGAGTRRDDDPGWTQRRDIRRGDFIVTDDLDFAASAEQQVRQVVRERIVIIDQYHQWPAEDGSTGAICGRGTGGSTGATCRRGTGAAWDSAGSRSASTDSPAGLPGLRPGAG